MHHTMELASRIDRQADGWTPGTACITEDGTDGWIDGRTDTGRMQYAVELASRTPEESTNSAEAGAATAPPPPPPATLVEEPSSADTSARSRKQ